MPDDYGWIYWKGTKVLKTPAALFVQQELIWESKPDIIVETGTKYGGSACFYADLGVEVVSVDVAFPKPPTPHFLVQYVIGYSTEPATLFKVEQAIGDKRCMVVLDSDHSRQNVSAELDLYAGYVTPGCYLIVEDLNQGGPQEALDEWSPAHPEFKWVERPAAPEHGYLLRWT